jgi:DNA-binding CsgD family transcriptional regulator
MLEFLYEAGEVDGPEVFTEPVLTAFRGLIDADRGGTCNVFHGPVRGSRPEQRSVLDFSAVTDEWCVDGELYWDDEFDDVCRLYVADEEAIPPQPRFMLRPLRLSDVLTSRQQRARKLWFYVERHFGEDAVWLWLPAPDEDVVRRIIFHSERRGGISDRDVRILELLTPHLVQLYRRAHARGRAPAGAEGLTPREYEIVSLVGAGKSNKEIAQALSVSPKTVGKHLENVFEKLGVTNRTAAAARVFGRTIGANRVKDPAWHSRDGA